MNYSSEKTRQYVYISLLCAQGVIIGLIERMIPFPFAFAPGAKLGLANIITIVSIYTLPVSESFLLMLMRLVLTTLLGGTMSTFMYSVAGSFLSWFGMLLIKQFGEKHVSMIGISAAGGILFNIGQLSVASWIAGSWTVMLYMPILSFIGILAGIAVGIAANFLFEHVRTLSRLRFEYSNVKERI
ncbi:Gx transporter family protein [Oenococcus oeni]|uniref:Heptaprenyl diphosphate synthase n=1 Tax=Oenococcus oeni TaxID=1247 RepID=A0A6N4A6I7_OENOE|nr:Gx transporter family protein [Oenococcus oeni]MDV7714675.1 heptaprenyl diphosphate synthase [Oenococcus oeni]OIL37978.1 heptaprenyl diphosphate synthase [Oenococcus oeni]OIM21185.1 heptaprenyl diphosphate synthase [Oenococcus oeni]OIM23207.1 heptaprenyl diphosphate synthase [Oenococcus oeni]OIM26499.1 heptaprenyl diphosphate synthase [Oenococcus oeni]